MQFESQRMRGTHDAMANMLEFLRDSVGMHRIVISMDGEVGFDRLDRSLLRDILAARGCCLGLNGWNARWCEVLVVRFRFNGRISRDYFVAKGIPQGAPLLQFLFGVYVADVLMSRIWYGPLVRIIVLCYLDGTTITILVAVDSRSLASSVGIEMSCRCSEVAATGGLGFCALKMEWIGIGDLAREPINIHLVRLALVDEMSVLGYQINRYSNWSDHVKYWLNSGLLMRNRISVVPSVGGCSWCWCLGAI